MYPTAAEPWRGCFVAEQVEDLRRAGIDVDVLAFDGRHDRRAYVRAVRGIRARARGGYDLVHAHYGLAGAAALGQREAPLVTTFHGSDIGYVPWQRHVSWVVARLSYPIFVSRAGARALGLPRADVIPAAADTDRFRILDRAEARRRLGWSPGARYALLPGPRDNLRKNAPLFDATLQRLGRRIAIESVALEGWSRDEAVLVLNAADAMLMTSDWEGSPVAVRESLACGTPVVSVDVGDVPEVLHGLPGCAVAARDPVELAAAVGGALDLRDRETLRRRAKSVSRPVVAARLVSLYERVLSA